MDWVVAPVDQILFAVEDDVNVTVFPAHKLTGPAGEIVGVDKVDPTVTTMEFETSGVQAPTVFVTVYVPGVDTVIEGVVAPFDQVMFVVTLEVRVTDPPEQNVVGPPAVITGVWLTVTVIPVDGAEVHPVDVYVTV